MYQENNKVNQIMETITMSEILPKKDTISGKWFYDQRPSNTRIAELHDFYTWNETLQKDFLILNKPFLVHSFQDNKFWASRTTERFPYDGSDFLIFLENKRIYVFDF